MSAVTIDKLTVDLDRVRVLHAVDAAVPEGGWLALIGPNGAGKTTRLRVILGLQPVTSGAVLFQIRLPRIVVGLMVVGLLSEAGPGYQGVFLNTLVDSGMQGA